MKTKVEKRPKLTELTAITPIDGRYRDRVVDLASHVSEYSLIATRIEVEAKYLIALSDIGIVRPFKRNERGKLNSFGPNLTLQSAQKVKRIEEETRHDVKAMELVFRSLVKGTSLEDVTEMIHFGLTSEDVNNLAYRLMLIRATEHICVPAIDHLVTELVDRAEKYKSTPMLARTHGQAAMPTTVGKEIVVFAARLNKELRDLEERELTGKLTGAVGNLNALQFAYPKIDWLSFSQNFVRSFGFRPSLATTQINPYEDMIAHFQNYQRINGIIIDFAQDMWRYVSDDWFVQEVRTGERGSSTMPQKVNPIDFENGEGNLTMANGIFETLCRKLSTSRLQRDLSDSTTIRNIGTALGYSLVGYTSILNGLSRVRPNEEQIAQDLNKDWAILAEGAQTIMRTLGVNDPYSLMASLTRGRHIDQAQWRTLVDQLPIPEENRITLRNLRPETYLGNAIEITERAIEEIKLSRK